MSSTKTVKCPVDGRLFATKRALHQHNVAAHSSKQKSNGAQGNRKISKASVPRGMGVRGETAVFSGSDLIGSVTVVKTAKPGTTLLAWDVNPMTLVNTRIHQFGSVFTRWRPKRLAVVCIPGAGSFTPGSYVIGWTADDKFNLGSIESRVQRVTTLVPNIMATFGSQQRLNISTDTTQKWYLTKPGFGTESDHGIVVAVLAGFVGGENITLNFKLDWTIEFNSPDVPESSEDQETYPDPSYLPIFTDSVSDWASGNRLTFKHSEGGSVVPFINLKDNTVYKPDKGVNVPYYKADGSEGSVSFFAKIKNSSLYTTALICFETEAKAKAYISTGDTSNALQYKAAGNYATPTLPTFTGYTVGEQPLLDLRHATLRRHKPPSIQIELPDIEKVSLASSFDDLQEN